MKRNNRQVWISTDFAAGDYLMASHGCLWIHWICLFIQKGGTRFFIHTWGALDFFSMDPHTVAMGPIYFYVMLSTILGCFKHHIFQYVKNFEGVVVSKLWPSSEEAAGIPWQIFSQLVVFNYSVILITRNVYVRQAATGFNMITSNWLVWTKILVKRWYTYNILLWIEDL